MAYPTAKIRQVFHSAKQIQEKVTLLFHYYLLAVQDINSLSCSCGDIGGIDHRAVFISQFKGEAILETRQSEDIVILGDVPRTRGSKSTTFMGAKLEEKT